MKDFTEYLKYFAENCPNQIAVVSGAREITYAEFAALYNSFSDQLQNVKTKPKVVLDLHQGIEAYALIIAILNINGTFCPLNPDSPLERKKQIIAEFAPDIIIVDAEMEDLTTEGTVIYVISDLISNENFNYDQASANNEDVAYVIYTSGSTGSPKGVMIYRKALNKFLEWSIPTYGANEKDRWAQFSLLSFDLSIVDIFTCLCSGATLVTLVDPSSKVLPSEVIEKHGITIWHSVPSVVDFMIKRDEAKKVNFSTLRLLSFCGESLRKYQAEFIFSKNSKVAIFNTYGPTEGTLFCTWQEFTSDNYLEFAETTISLGKPIPGWNLFLRPEVGDEKEIIIYGEFIGKGYVGEDRDNRFKTINIEGNAFRSFDTGDLVFEKNGHIFFSCRKDRQVKIRGNRVELGEIDSWLRDWGNVNCITIAHNGTLYSFIETENSLNEIEIREFLSKNLEAYKIPRTFIALKALPRSANLKIDIKALLKEIND